MPILNFKISANDSAGPPPSELLGQKGPVVPVMLRAVEAQEHGMAERGEGPTETVSGLALVDSGASVTCVDQTVAERMGLAVVDMTTISSASHASHEVPIYACRMEIPRLAMIACPRAMGATLENLGLVALIGRDVLRQAVLIYNGPAGTFSLCT